MICSECGNECGYERFNNADGITYIDISLCCSAKMIMKKDNNMDWKDLDKTTNIACLDDRNYIYQFSTNPKRGNWLNSGSSLSTMVTSIILDSKTKYRYRLKPLEPIRITKEIFDIINDSHTSVTLDMDIEYMGRKVEIIY